MDTNICHGCPLESECSGPPCVFEDDDEMESYP